MKRIYWLILGLLLPTAAHATVIPQFFTQTYTCTGSTGPFPFNYPLSAPPAMTVTKNGVLLASTAYSIIPINNNYTNGGSITLLSACPAGQTLVLKRATPLTQTSVFTDNMPIPMKTLENGLDKLTEIMQEQAARLIDIQAGFVSGHCTNLVFISGRWTLVDSGGPCGTGGGGGNCPVGAAYSVQYNNFGACAGDSKFTFNPSYSNGRVLVNQGAIFEIDGVDDTNYSFLNGDQFILFNHGESSDQTAVAVHLDETAYTGPGNGPLAYDAIFEVDKSGHSGTGFLTEPGVGGLPVNTIIGFQSGAPTSTGGALNKFYGFAASAGGNHATTEEFAYFARPIEKASIHANYCDFMSRNTDGVRESIGCGPTATSLFGGPVSVADGSGQGGTFDGSEGTAATPAAGHDLMWADAASNCWKISNNGGAGVCIPTSSGGGGLSGQTVNYLPKANSATTSTGPSILSDDGTTATVHGALGLPLDTVSAINAGSGTPDPYTTWNFANAMTTTPFPSSTYREATYFAAIPTLGADDSSVHWSAMNGFTFPGDDHNYHALFGGQWEGYTTRAGNIFELDGGAMGAFHDGSGTVGIQIGGKITSVAQSTGSITTNYGSQITTGNQGSGTIATNYGIDVESAGSGPITTNYGIHIQPQTGGATNYNLFSAGATTHNTVEGDLKVGFGSTPSDVCTQAVPCGAGGPPNVIYASIGNGSVAGCTLNSNVLTGGGTVVTACLQAQLDWLATNYPQGSTEFIDGAALIDQTKQGSTNPVEGNVQTACLQMHSNQTIDASLGGVFLKSASNCNLLSNNPVGNPAATFQKNMTVVGGIWNGNNANQSQFEQAISTNMWNTGFWFSGFDGLTIDNVTLRNVATFNFVLSNGKNFLLSNDTVTETTTVPSLSTYQDGIHFYGTLSNGTVTNFADNNGDDDPLAFNTDEGVSSYNSGVTTPFFGYQRFPWSGGALNNIFVKGVHLTTTATPGRFYGVVTTGGVATVSNIRLQDFSGTASTPMPNSGITAAGPVTVDNWQVSQPYVFPSPFVPIIYGNSGGFPLTGTGVALTNPSSGIISVDGGIVPFQVNTTSNIASGIRMTGTGTGVDNWAIYSAGTGLPSSGHRLHISDDTAGGALWALYAAPGFAAGYIENPSWLVNCWSSLTDVTATACDTGLSRDAAGVVDVGNGTAGNASGTLKAATGTYSTALTVAGNNVCQSTGTNCPAGGTATTIASSETVASSATPTFSVSFNVSYNVLTANVTSFTLAAGSDGQSKTLTFCQNGTGNFTVAAPANVHGFFTVGLTASKCSSQHFNYSTAQTAWLADSAGVVNE